MFPVSFMEPLTVTNLAQTCSFSVQSSYSVLQINLTCWALWLSGQGNWTGCMRFTPSEVKVLAWGWSFATYCKCFFFLKVYFVILFGPLKINLETIYQKICHYILLLKNTPYSHPMNHLRILFGRLNKYQKRIRITCFGTST